MAIKDVLLALSTYPDPTPDASIDCTLALCAQLTAQATGVAFAIEMKPAHRTNFLVNMMVDVPAMAAEETAKSRAHAAHVQSYFRASATRLQVRSDTRSESCEMFSVAGAIAEEAKLHDLTIFAMQNIAGVEQWHAEVAMFGSGRPVLVLPGPARLKPDFSLARITLAWDYSRPAVRALADALPLLQIAGKVRVVTIENEKKLDARIAPERLSQHLAAHGVQAEFATVDARGRTAEAALRADLVANSTDLLVMGAFGHSRVREFVLGGTTRSMLEDTPVPVLFSH